MGKLIRKRTFLGNIALVIFLAFMATVTFGAIPAYAAVTPTAGSFTSPDGLSTPGDMKVIDKTGNWQGTTVNLEATNNRTKVKFTFQVLTDNFDSILLQLPGMLAPQLVKDMDPSVVSATYKAVDSTVYSIYQIIYSYVYGPGFDITGTNNGYLKVTASGILKSIILDLEEPVPITPADPTVTVTPAAPSVSVTPTTPAATITVPSTVTNATVNVAQMLNNPTAAGTVSTDALPALTIQANVPAVSATQPVVVSIPAGTHITGPASWTGTIEVPRTVVPPVVPGQTATSAIEIGFGDVPLTFDQPVKIVLPGKAGQNVKWTRGNDSGEIIAISACTTAGEANLELNRVGKEEGKHNSGADLVVWTRHFTTFVTYTVSAGGGGGGGGVTPSPVTSTTGSASVTPSAGGSIGLGSDATVKIPADALKGTSQVEVKVQKVTSPAAAPTGYKLVSGAYDFIVGGSHSYTFNKKVSVILKFDPALVGAGQTPVIFNRQDGATTWTKIGGTVSGSTITAEVDHFTQFAVMVEDKKVEPPVPEGLTDIKGHWAEKAILDMVAKDLLGGYPDKTFKPDQTMSRTEFAVVVAKAFNLKPDATYTLKFKDASKIPAWGKAYVAAAVKAGIVSGDNRGNFNPAGNVTRAEMACMVGRALEAKVTASPKFGFKDKVPTWAAGYVDYLVKKDVLAGYGDNTFKPNKTATRAEACTVIFKASKL